MRRSAGLPLSVGRASLAVRLVIALVLLATASLCIGGGILIATDAVARIVAVLFVIPVGLVGGIAAAFVIAPLSRFGIWLDHAIPRLRRPWTAFAAAVSFWVAAFLLTQIV